MPSCSCVAVQRKMSSDNFVLVKLYWDIISMVLRQLENTGCVWKYRVNHKYSVSVHRKEFIDNRQSKKKYLTFITLNRGLGQHYMKDVLVICWYFHTNLVESLVIEWWNSKICAFCELILITVWKPQPFWMSHGS